MSFDDSPRMGNAVQYNGQYFDSWTEGVWAAYFDQAGMPFVHEPETFLLPEVKIELENFTINRRPELYTPDFFLPEQDVYVEVKNGNTDDGTSYKLIRLARLAGKAGLLVNGKPQNANVFGMSPDPSVQPQEYRHYGLFASGDFSLYRSLAHANVGHPLFVGAIRGYIKDANDLVKPLSDIGLMHASKERKRELRKNVRVL